LIAGNGVRLMIVPPALPPPGSEPDILLLQRLEKDIDRLELVRKMRSSATVTDVDGVGRMTDTSEGGWIELPSSRPPSAPVKWAWKVPGTTGAATAAAGGGSRAPGQEQRTFTDISLAGFRGLGIGRTFYNPHQHALLRVVWFGSGLTGWPGVVHGGSTCTVLSDAMGALIAIEELEGVDVHKAGVLDPDSISLTYVKRTTPHDFYAVRVSMQDGSIGEVEEKAEKATRHIEKEKDMTKQSQPVDKRKTLFGGGARVKVLGTIERLDGTVCVKAVGEWEK
jgi:hypothetical protein